MTEHSTVMPQSLNASLALARMPWALPSAAACAAKQPGQADVIDFCSYVCFFPSHLAFFPRV